MPGIFYSDERIYRAELDAIWRKGWLFAGHSCEIKSPGDYFTLNVDGDSLIIVRNDDGAAKALWNVCRHRGTELCDEGSGRVGRIVCPYHQWTFARDGRLLSCRGMQEQIDKSELGLREAELREVAGLLFVSLAEEPPPFDEAYALFDDMAAVQGLDRAKIAKTV